MLNVEQNYIMNGDDVLEIRDFWISSDKVIMRESCFKRPGLNVYLLCECMNISLLKYSWTICAVVNVNSWARSLTVRVWTVMDWLLSCGTSVNIFNINIFNTNIFNQHCEEQFLWPRLIRLCIGKLAFRPFDWFQES